MDATKQMRSTAGEEEKLSGEEIKAFFLEYHKKRDIEEAEGMQKEGKEEVHDEEDLCKAVSIDVPCLKWLSIHQ